MNVLFISLAVLFRLATCDPRNDRPIIGVLAQEQYGKEARYGKSYIAASYVKFLESAGARVVPIKVNQSKPYYENLLKSINGVLFPGGGANISTSGYGKAGRIIYDLAIQENKKGDYFPLWGTCLGFELLNLLAIGKECMQLCNIDDVALPLINNRGYNDSRLFEHVPKDIEHILTTEPVAINYHRWCLTPQNYSECGLDKFYKILTLSEYKNNTFISSIEAFGYPFYAVAFHPEKTQFEFVVRNGLRNIPHTANSILASQYFANFFVNEARKNQHHFQNKTEENEALIYNYQAVYTGINGSNFEQKYFFS